MAKPTDRTDERILAAEKREAIAIDMAFQAFLSAFGKGLMGVSSLAGSKHVHSRIVVTEIERDGTPAVGMPVRVVVSFGEVMGRAAIGDVMKAAGMDGAATAAAAVANAVESSAAGEVDGRLGEIAAALLRERERVILEQAQTKMRLYAAIESAAAALADVNEPLTAEGKRGPIASAKLTLGAMLDPGRKPL
jgi:hypothetical protein